MVISFLFFSGPVVALVGLLLYWVGYMLFRSRSGKLPFLRHFTLWAFLCYCLALVYLTLLWYWPDITFRPEYYFLNLHPFVWLSEIYTMGAAKMYEQLMLNIGMFVPLGFLFPIIFPSLRRFWKTALCALTATLMIETLQYFMGRSADIDDVIMNFAGGVIGYLLYALCARVFTKCGFWKKLLLQTDVVS